MMHDNAGIELLYCAFGAACKTQHVFRLAGACRLSSAFALPLGGKIGFAMAAAVRINLCLRHCFMFLKHPVLVLLFVWPLLSSRG